MQDQNDPKHRCPVPGPFQASLQEPEKRRETFQAVPGKNEAKPRQNRGSLGFASVSLGTGYRGNQTAKFTGETRGQGRERLHFKGGALAERSRAQRFVRKFPGGLFCGRDPDLGMPIQEPKKRT